MVIDFGTAPLRAAFDLGVKHWVARDCSSPNVMMDMFAEPIYLMDGYYFYLFRMRLPRHSGVVSCSKWMVCLDGDD